MGLVELVGGWNMTPQPRTRTIDEESLLCESRKFVDFEEYLFNVRSSPSAENEATKSIFLLRYE